MKTNGLITSSRRIVYNTVLNITIHVVELGINFLLISFFLGKLGEQRYGVWVLVASIFQYRMLLSMGLNSAINRYIPVYLARNDFRGVSQITSTAFFVLLLLGCALASLTILIALNVGYWFALPNGLLTTARTLVLLVGFSFAISFPLQISSAILSGIQRYDVINLIELLAFVTRTLLLILLLRQGCGLLTMGLLFGCCEIIIRIAQFRFSRKLLPQARIVWSGFNGKVLREAVAYGTNSMLYTMGTVILFKAGNIVIGIFMGASSISRFSIAGSAVMLLTSFTGMFSRAIKPAVSDLDARGDMARVREIAFLTQKYTLFLLIPACCFLVAMGREFLSVWVGAKILDASVLDIMASVMAILAVANTIRLAQHSNFIVMVGRGQHKIFGILAVMSAAVFLILSIFLLKFFNFGLIAVAWSTFIPVVLTSGLILPLYFNRRMRISLRENIKYVWMPALQGTLPAVLMITAWKFVAPPQSWSQLIAVVLLAGIVTLFSSWHFSLTPVEQKRFGSMLYRK